MAPSAANSAGEDSGDVSLIKTWVVSASNKVISSEREQLTDSSVTEHDDRILQMLTIMKEKQKVLRGRGEVSLTPSIKCISYGLNPNYVQF